MIVQRKKATISDIAKCAGVSCATVSRVMSHSGYPVKKEVKQRVLEAAKQLDYHPNIFSQKLKGGSCMEIGVIVPSVTNPFYADLVSAVEHECQKYSYTPVFCFSQNSPEQEKKYLEVLERKQVEGMLLSSVYLSETSTKMLDDYGIPFVLFDQVSPDYQGDCVGFDFFKGGYMATKYIIDHGHRNIAFASGPVDRYSRRDYLSGYSQALSDAGIKKNKKQIFLYEEAQKDGSVETDFQCGYELGNLLLSREYLPDAIVAVNDMIAVGIMRALEQQGIHVPADVSIIGFDNISVSSLMSPALTTIEQPAAETGRIATEILLNRLKNKGGEAKRITLFPKLIERESVRKLHKKIRH